MRMNSSEYAMTSVSFGLTYSETSSSEKMSVSCTCKNAQTADKKEDLPHAKLDALCVFAPKFCPT